MRMRCIVSWEYSPIAPALFKFSEGLKKTVERLVFVYVLSIIELKT